MTTTPGGSEEPSTAEEADPPRRVGRRAVLGRIGIGVGAVAVLGAGGVTVRAANNGVFDAGEGAPYDLARTWRSIPGLRGLVAAGVLAASPHNMQPWRFGLGSDRVELFDDPSRGMPHVDPAGRERQIGFGCCLENMVVAGNARGRAPRVELGSGGPVAALVAGEGPVADAELAAVIGSRHSNRGPYTSRAVSADLLAELAAEVAGLEGVQLRWITDPVAKEALGALLVDAAQAVVADSAQSKDGFAWFRNDRGDIDRYRDGLTLDGQGLSPLMLAMAKILPAYSRTRGDAFWVQQTREVHTRTAAAYGVVTTDGPLGPEVEIAAGRLVERLHLQLTRRGLAMQYLSQATERIDREAELGLSPGFAQRYDDILGSGELPVATVRIGYPERSGRPSPRRELAAVLA